MLNQHTGSKRWRMALWTAPALLALSLLVPLTARADHNRTDALDVLVGAAVIYALVEAADDRHRHYGHRGHYKRHYRHGRHGHHRHGYKHRRHHYRHGKRYSRHDYRGTRGHHRDRDRRYRRRH